MTFPIYTRETAMMICAKHIRQLSSREPGVQKHIVGDILPDHFNEQSFLIVRRRTRKIKMYETRQGRNNRYYWSEYYCIASADYCTASLSWISGILTELQPYATMNEATKALRTLRRLSPKPAQ